MTSTSDELAIAAEAMRTLVGPDPGYASDGEVAELDLIIACQARDQVRASLVISLFHLFPPLHWDVRMGPADMLLHPALGLIEVLRRRRAVGVEGPAPTDVALRPPTSGAAQAWVTVVNSLEVVAVQLSRIPVDWHAGAAALARADWRPSTSSSVDPNLVLWALTADLAAVAGALAIADSTLAATLSAASAPGWKRGIAHLREPSIHEVSLTAAAALRLASNGVLPAAYDVPTAQRVPTAVTSLDQVVDGFRAALSSVVRGPTMTRGQQRSLALAMAQHATAVAPLADHALRQRLNRFATVAANYSVVWAGTSASASDRGNAQAVSMLQRATQYLATPEAERELAAGGENARAALMSTLTYLVPLATAAVDNAHRGLTRGDFLVALHTAGEAPDWRSAGHHRAGAVLENAGRSLWEANEGVRQLVALERRPVIPADPSRTPARDVLHEVVDRPLHRPAHPGIPPTGRLSRLPGPLPAAR